MKKPRYLLPSAALLVPSAVLIATVLLSKHTSPPEPEASATVRKPSATNGGILGGRPILASFADQGMLWETVAKTDRERAVTAVPVDSKGFRAAQRAELGEVLDLRLSDRIPVLRGEVTGRSTAEDGTVVTNLRVEGDPVGQLTIQENPDYDFFLAQLYYENHPVAYEFAREGGQLMATRHELSSLLCSLIDRKKGEVTAMGLPKLNLEKAKKLIAEAKGAAGGGGSTTGRTFSIADASVTEGNSGNKSLTFTVRISKSDRSKSFTVSYSTANGTAVDGSDFVAASGTVTIAPSRTSVTLTVPIIGDTAIEPDETFFVNLSNPVNAALGDAQAVGTIVNDDVPPSSSNVPVFNSLPGAVAVAYLDMDGQVVSGTSWAGGGTITARGVVGTLTDAQILDVCRRTAEDFAPFDINVTTEESVFLAAPSNRRIRVIITPDNEWYGAYGGVAYLNSFTWTGDTPCWVFSDQLGNSPRYIAEATSHEIGHTLSLRHDGRVSPAEGYYQGHGSGEVGWAPIMGVGYYKPLVQWSKGEYLSANQTEDDLLSITTKNGFGYRADGVGDSVATAVDLPASRATTGIIERTGDSDVFRFTTIGGACSFTVLGDAASQNLDLLAEILDASGAVVAAANPDTLTDATVSATLASGTYFLRVSGVGRGDVLGEGYSNYGSLGQYSVNGSAP